MARSWHCRRVDDALQERWDAAVASLPPAGDDVDLEVVADFFLAADPFGERMAAAVRESLDQVYDGPRTGRFRYSELRKTEKTHVGTIVEINIAREFDLDAYPTDPTDYRIEDVLVDCKYSMKWGGWQIPTEAWGHVVLLVWAADDEGETGVWSAGLWRVDPRLLGGGKNRDQKRTITKAAMPGITMLWDHAPLPENTLLHLPDDVVAEIFKYKKRGGQKRTNALFRLVQGKIIRREVVLTVALQRDALRRARMAREPRYLGSEGIVVLGHYKWDVAVAKALGLAVPRSGEWISVRVVPAAGGETGPTFEAAGGLWRKAHPDDPVVPAPPIPRAVPLDPEDVV